MNPKTSFLFTVCLAGFFAAQGVTSRAEDKYIPAPAEAVARWQAERFGMFIHWGPVSIKGTEIGWSRAGERRDRKETVTKGVPAEEYDNLYKQFNPEQFNADEWASIAKAAGMKYMVLIAKHHDGFCMFDSKLTDYKITNTPFKRDVTAELAKACKKAGLRFSVYYSPPDWHHPDFCTENHARYIEYLHGQVRELLTNYGPLQSLWFDRTGGVNNSATWDNPGLFKMIRQLQPDILVTTRCGSGPLRGPWGDFSTPEQRVGGFQMDFPWETCMTICHQWAWKPNDKLKSLKECLEALIFSAGGDGNLLFNVGPMPNGEIEPRQVDRLKEMGDWLSKYGESIYGTRGGPWKPTKSLASTRKGSTVYLHIVKWNGDSITLPAPPAKIVSSKLLTGGSVKLDSNGDNLVITVPQSDRQEIDTLVELKLDAPAESIPPITVPDDAKATTAPAH